MTEPVGIPRHLLFGSIRLDPLAKIEGNDLVLGGRATYLDEHGATVKVVESWHTRVDCGTPGNAAVWGSKVNLFERTNLPAYEAHEARRM